MANLKISVIMSVYNGEKYLREAIGSILNQTFTDFEFIIVNDGSMDNTLEIIQSYVDERIKIINNEKNIGLTKSLNKAIKVARGEYIARQDADDISLPNRFEEQVKYFDRHPEVALLGTSNYVINEDGKILWKNIASHNPRKKLVRNNQFIHGSTIFKKEIIDKLGGYNELFRYSQDYELWLRIAKYYKVRNLIQILYKLRMHNERVGVTNLEKSVLYHFLALKVARYELDEEILKVVRAEGIKSLYSYLNKNEKIAFHKTIAYTYIVDRKEYRKIFDLNPFDMENNINIILSYFGVGVMIRSYKIYRIVKNFIIYLKNYFQK